MQLPVLALPAVHFVLRPGRQRSTLNASIIARRIPYQLGLMENSGQSREAAQQHLLQIRAEKGLGDLQGPKAIFKDLDAALKVYVEHRSELFLAVSQILTPPQAL